MELENKLAAIPVDEWLTEQAIVFDWQDGPSEGLCSLRHPEAEFQFELLDQRHNPDDLDDRLFRLRQLPMGTVAEALRVLSVLGQPTHCVWAPLWRFADAAQQRQAEKLLDELQAKATPLDLVIASRDMKHFQGCWRSKTANGEAVDWFARLVVPTTPRV